SHRLPKFLLLACLLSLAFASLARAAAPATVTVRVEGVDQTLLAPTTVTTSGTPVEKDGNPSHTCSGGSAAGALELATSGNWNGEWFSGIGYSVETILGETLAFEPGAAANFFWTYWLDNKESSSGICEGELSSGDSVLFFPACFSETEPSSCPVAPNPLGVDAPSVAEAGAPFTVTVTSYANPSGAASPAVGATVSGAGAEATTNAAGQATLTLSSSGHTLLHVSAANAVRTEANVCVHKGNDGNCGTTTPGSASTSTSAAPVAAATYSGPYAVVAKATSVAEGHVYTPAKAPRVLSGTVASHAQVSSVEMRLRRSYRGRCFAYNGTSERFGRASCGSGSFFKVSSAPSFSYLLPGALAPGRYVLDLEAVDAAGHRSTLARGTSRIVFYVR
ncbi:MAG TPA: hypothetical protein VK761_00155, partial [Solirubrobacteraceae bacterium]|nr:hypothetical protein [Solirubrobacteraceae bacterium]